MRSALALFIPGSRASAVRTKHTSFMLTGEHEPAHGSLPLQVSSHDLGRGAQCHSVCS
jgi:hypothetical protein